MLPLTLFTVATLIGIFVPIVIARIRNHNNFSSILLLSVFTAWTGIGWVAATVWAFSDNTAAPRSTNNDTWPLLVTIIYALFYAVTGGYMTYVDIIRNKDVQKLAFEGAREIKEESNKGPLPHQDSVHDAKPSNRNDV